VLPLVLLEGFPDLLHGVQSGLILQQLCEPIDDRIVLHFELGLEVLPEVPLFDLLGAPHQL